MPSQKLYEIVTTTTLQLSGNAVQGWPLLGGKRENPDFCLMKERYVFYWGGGGILEIFGKNSHALPLPEMDLCMTLCKHPHKNI